jgi:hypothetical protein
MLLQTSTLCTPLKFSGQHPKQPLSRRLDIRPKCCSTTSDSPTLFRHVSPHQLQQMLPTMIDISRSMGTEAWTHSFASCSQVRTCSLPVLHNKLISCDYPSHSSEPLDLRTDFIPERYLQSVCRHTKGTILIPLSMRQVSL